MLLLNTMVFFLCGLVMVIVFPLVLVSRRSLLRMSKSKQLNDKEDTWDSSILRWNLRPIVLCKLIHGWKVVDPPPPSPKILFPVSESPHHPRGYLILPFQVFCRSFVAITVPVLAGLAASGGSTEID